MKRRIFFRSFLVIAFLLSLIINNAPSGKIPEFHNIPEISAFQLRHLSNLEKQKIEKEEYLEKKERGVDSSNVDLVGIWPYGPCQATALDTSRNIALIGNGEALQVLDISTPSAPSNLGEVVLQIKPRDIVISGNYAYVVSRNSLRTIDISTLSNPVEVGSADVSGYGYALAVASNYAFVAAGNDGLRVFDISAPASPVEIGDYSADNNTVFDAAIWSNYAFIFNYFFTGTDWVHQLRVIDISTPSFPSLTGTYQGDVGWDFTGLDSSDTGYAYISQHSVTSNASKLTILDVGSDPSHPSEVGFYLESDRNFGDVAVSGNYAYVFGRSWNYLEIIDVSNPTAPFFVEECHSQATNFYDLDVSDNYVGISHLGDGFGLYDISDPGNPSHISFYATPDSFGTFGNPIVVCGDFAYVANRSDGLRIFDISTPSNPSVAGICDTVDSPYGITIYGNYAYGVDSSGFWMIDVSSPSSPSQIGYLDIPWDTRDVAVKGDYAYVSGYQYVSSESRLCLGVIDISDPFTLELVGSYVCSSRSLHYGGVALSENYAYLALFDYSSGIPKAGLKIIDVSNPFIPTEAGSYASAGSGTAFNVKVRSNYAFLAGNEFRIIDISNPASPNEISSYLYTSQELALSGDYAYLGAAGLRVIDISDLNNSTEAGYYYNDLGSAVAVSGNYTFMLGSFYVLKNSLAPEVSITSPSAWSYVAGAVSVEAQASHSSGIAQVELYIDDILQSTDLTSPYSFLWDTSLVAEGLHTIRARAYNNDGKSSDAEIEVTVKSHWNLTISSNPGGTTIPVPGQHSYSPGTDALVEALPNSGYTFSGWIGDVSPGHENDNPITISMDADKSITAGFNMIPGYYGLTINPALGGTTSPDPGDYAYAPGTEVLITASPDPGNSFSHWSGDVPSGHENDNPLSITMDANKSVTPHFSFPSKSWTLMFYLDGDNNLEESGINNFLNMSSMGSDGNINIVVQFDRIDGYDSSYGNWTSTKRFYVTNGLTPTPENALQDLGELNHGDPQTLIDFVNWAKTTYPASNYGLILWNHGGGWRIKGEKLLPERLQGKNEPSFRAVCWDDTDGSDTLFMDEVQSALDSTGGAHLIGFDACFMGMVEVAYEIRNNGDVMVGSEETAISWPWDTILQDLKSNPTWSASELGPAIVDRYFELTGNRLTLSAIDLSNMDALATSISSFAQTIIDYWDSDQNAVKLAAQDVMAEIGNTVIHEQHGTEWMGANGLAIYFAETSGGNYGFSIDYNGTIIDFPNDTQWEEFLQEFYSSMEDSWIAYRRAGLQQFDWPQHTDLYHFCQLINTEPRSYYTESQILQEYIGGGTAQNFHANDDVMTYTLPFDFPYFGETIPAGTDIYICSNGYVDFVVPATGFSYPASELVSNKRIVPFSTNLSTNGSAQANEDIYITENPSNLIIRWLAEIDYYRDPVNVELILYADGRIQFNYDGGNAISSGWPPSVGISKGDGLYFNLSAYHKEYTLTNVDSYLFTPATLDVPPAVSITAPSDGEIVSGTVNIGASASDDNEVFKVEFYIDDVLISTDGLSPYSCSWDTLTYSNGTHKIEVIAYDSIDQTDSHEISVTVSNFTLTISTTTGGTTDPVPGTYSCLPGTEAVITATPDSGYSFCGWTGDVPSGHELDNPITVIVDSDKSIEANFIPQHTLGIIAGTGGTTNPPPGTYAYDEGTSIIVEAIPNFSYRFDHWTGDIPQGHEKDNPVTITMDSDKDITAHFVRQYMLTLIAEQGGTTQPAPGTHIYDSGASVGITAYPDSGYRFSNWSGDVSSTDIHIDIDIDGDKVVTAHFIRLYTLTISTAGEGTTDPVPGAYDYDTGEEVIISAIPESGHEFIEWSGDISGTENPITVIMDLDKSVTANFEPVEEEPFWRDWCFIATAAYGSSMHPHLDILRDFRDKYLMSSKVGRKFVELYYEYSPLAASFISKHKVLKVVVRIHLLPVVVFCYSMIHFGPTITSAMIFFILMVQMFLIVRYRRGTRRMIS